MDYILPDGMSFIFLERFNERVLKKRNHLLKLFLK